MRFQFGNPNLLLLLVVLVPFVVWLGRRLSLVTRFRRALIVTTRIVIIFLLVLTLAQIQYVKSSDVLDVYFVIDGSDSVPESERARTLKFVGEKTQRMRTRDRAGIAVFGGDAVIEEIPSPRLQVEKLLSQPIREATNIGEAIRLAMAALPGEHKRRIVLASDGNENAGSAIEAAKSARAHGIPIDVFPMRYEYENDIVVEGVVVDSRVHVDEPFDLKVFVRSNRDTKADMSISLDGKLLSNQPIQLEAGKKNAFVLNAEVAESEFHTYRVSIDVGDDNNLANNQGYAFTYAGGPPKVLYVEGESDPPEGGSPIIPYLQSEKISVHQAVPDALPYDPGALQGYSSVILANVSAGELGEARMKALEQAVHELGIGLIMVGGDNTFGAGGFQDSPVEKALPVRMDVPHKKVLPKGALVIVLHTCEIAQGNTWSQKIALAALDVMSSRDLMGILYFGVPSGVGMGVPTTTWGEQWLYTLQEVGNKVRMRSLIKSCVPGDMPSMDKTLQMAHGALASCSASVKHIVLISDGDPQPPTKALLDQMKASNITVSTVCISPHTPTSAGILKDIALYTGGTPYLVNNPNQLPQIFIKEASLVRKPLLCEETFTPQQKAFSQVLAGIFGQPIPDLHGYVASTPKALADVPLITHKDDPLLAHWQYGVGKSVAFTSDAQAKWAAEWLGWDSFRKFWTQVVRWSLRGQLSQNYQMHTEIQDGVGHVVIDAVDPKGDFINFLDFQGGLVKPDLEREPLAFKQTGPGRYEASFPVGDTGSYYVSAHTGGEGEGEEPSLITGGLAIPYSPEHSESKSNEGLLRRIADISGGRYVEGEGKEFNAFDRTSLASGSQPEPFWPKTLALAILLIPVDVFFRRVMIDWRDIQRAWRAVWGWVSPRLKALAGRRSPQREEAMSALFEAKARAASKHAEPEGPSEEFIEALERAKREADRGVVDEAVAPTTSGKPAVVRKSEKEELRKPKATQPVGSYTSRLLEAKKRARKGKSER